jgi:hypothetical protein
MPWGVRLNDIYLSGGCDDEPELCIDGSGDATPHPIGELEVTQNVGDPLCVDIAAGGAWIDADLGGDCQGVYGVHNCGVVTLCADDGDPTDPRIDRVVFRVNDSSLGGTECDSELEIITGAASPAPVPPAEPANSITLALITVTSAGITVIDDQRRPFVTCGASRIPEIVLAVAAAPSSGTFTKANWPDASYFEVVIVGGGGGGGGTGAIAAGSAAVAGGGGGGAGCHLRVSYADMPDSVSWTMGGGGAGGTSGGGAGGSGSDSEFGDWTMGGGDGGVGAPAGSAALLVVQAEPGGTQVLGTFGTSLIRSNGDPSDPAVRLTASQFYSGCGGDGPLGYGVGGQPRTGAAAGFAGSGDGAGGAGAASANSGGFAGGAGSSGRIMVTAYY